MEETHPAEVQEIQRSLYFDDVITGMNTVNEAKAFMDTTIKVFKDTLQKWYSNVPELEATTPAEEQQQTYAKDQLGVKDYETKLLGLKWNKLEDKVKLAFLENEAQKTKSGILRLLASIFDHLGLVAPVTLIGKILYRDTWEQHLPWDKELSVSKLMQWEKFEESFPEEFEIPRSLVGFKEDIGSIDLRVFGDAGGAGKATVTYAVFQQKSGKNQGLVAAKACLAKNGLTIPRLELVSAHIAANLTNNVRDAIQGLQVHHVYGFLDSSVAFHWIKGGGVY